MSDTQIADPVLSALNEAREKTQEKGNPKQTEHLHKKIESRTTRLINAWKRWYNTNPDRPRFQRRKQEVDKLIDEISELKKRAGTFVPNWMVQAHEIFLRLYETKQI